MATLHILRNLDAALMAETAQVGDKLLLIQDGVLNPGPFSCEVAVSADDLTARGVQSPHRGLSYDGIRDLMLEFERVVLW